MVFLETVLAFIVLVGILVFIHELGHFLTARWTGMRADVFAVGMGPRLVGWNRKTGFSFGKLPEHLDLEGGTDYRIAMLPIGGYVKIAGMVDESMDTDFATRKPQPWEFRSKGAAAKILVISAGVIMNVLLAIALFSGLKLANGEEYYATTTLGALPTDGVAYKAGLRPGDKIEMVNGVGVKYFQDIIEQLAGANPNENVAVVINRAGATSTISLPRPSIATGPLELYPENQSVVVESTVSNTPAETAGFKKGDRIVAADNTPIASQQQLITYIQAHGKKAISFNVERAGVAQVITATPDSSTAKLGFVIMNDYQGATYHRDYSLGESVSHGFNQTMFAITGTFRGIWDLITGKAKLAQSVSGPVKIAKMARETGLRSLTEFLQLMGLLSVALACMNILPIPALDGGHLVFIITEAIMRREVPLKLRMVIQQVGFALLLIFMIFVIYNDTFN